MTNPVGTNPTPNQLPIPQDVHPAMTRFHQYLVDRHLESRKVFDRFDPANVIDGTYVASDEPKIEHKEQTLSGNPIEDFFTMLDGIFATVIKKLHTIRESMKVIGSEVSRMFA